MWFLLLLLLGGHGWNGWGNNGNGVNTEFSLLQDQAQQNQNTNLLREAMRDNFSAIQQLSQKLGCDFNTLSQCCCDMKAAIAQVGGQIGYSKEAVIAALNAGNGAVIQAIKDCCCGTQKEILKMGYDNQLAICNQTGELRNGQRDLGQAITQGFSQSSFQAQQDKCEIIRAGEINTQRIVDTMQAHWAEEKNNQILDLKNKLANAELYEKLRACGVNTGCCGNGCGNGCGF